MIYELEIMLAELESSQLEVVLVPSRREVNVGGMVRVAADRNCNWYRQFCARHVSSRGTRRGKFDTKIRRHKTIEVLNRMIRGYPSVGLYAEELRRIAQQRIANRNQQTSCKP